MKKLILFMISVALLMSGCAFSSNGVSINDTTQNTDVILTTEDNNAENSDMYDALVLKFMDAKPNALNPKQRNVAALITFDAEMMNGGLCQFFINDYHGYARYVSDALAEVGAHEMQKHYSSFLSENKIDVTKMDSFGVLSVEDYLKQYERFPYEAFDRTFSEIYEKENLGEILITYVQRHEDEILG